MRLGKEKIWIPLITTASSKPVFRPWLAIVFPNGKVGIRISFLVPRIARQPSIKSLGEKKKHYSRFDVGPSRVVLWITTNVNRILVLIDTDPVDFHGGRENGINVGIDVGKLEGHSQIDNDILIRKFKKDFRIRFVL